MLDSLFSLIVGFVLITVIVVVSRGGMGMGDAKLLALVEGSFLGWKAVFYVLFWGSVFWSHCQQYLQVASTQTRPQNTHSLQAFSGRGLRDNQLAHHFSFGYLKLKGGFGNEADHRYCRRTVDQTALTGCIRVKRPDIAVSGFCAGFGYRCRSGRSVEGRGWFPGRTVTSENGSWSFSKAKKSLR